MSIQRQQLKHIDETPTRHQKLLKEIRQQLQHREDLRDQHGLVEWIIDQFVAKCVKTGKLRLLSTNHLVAIRSCAMRIMRPHLQPESADFVMNQTNRYIREYNYTNDKQVTHAPVIPWQKMNKLALQLWWDTSRGRGTRWSTILQRKRASLFIFFTSICGVRWGAVTLLRWEHVVFSRLNNELWLHIRLPVSKTNIHAEVVQELTAKALPPQQRWSCLLHHLARYWLYMGKPARGLMFHDNHERITGDAEYTQMQRAASKLGWATMPGKHTGRVTVASSLQALGASDTVIDLFLHWRSDRMRKHYANRHTARSKVGAAFLLHQAMTTSNPEKKLSTIQKHLM